MEKKKKNRLSEIQQKLDVPKDRFNKFGNYSYRSAEDILNAVKDLLKDDELIICSDELVQIGDRYYVKATVTLQTGVGQAFATGYAREQETKKGMDASQITGAASSYARKYALAGLFAIEDGNDSDSMDNRSDGSKTKQVVQKEDDGKTWLNNPELTKAKKALDDGEVTLEKILEKYKVSRANMAFLKGEGELTETIQ